MEGAWRFRVQSFEVEGRGATSEAAVDRYQLHEEICLTAGNGYDLHTLNPTS